MSRSSSSATIATLGIDLGKNSFHLVGQDERGAIVLRLKLSRPQLTQRLANIPPCLIGMEACAGAHHIGRQLQALGHDVRLIPAQYVKPFLKGHKNDYRDAEAIAEAVQRPTMSFVAIKTPDQMDLLALHRVRSSVLTAEEEAIIVAFRRHTLLPLDDCLYGLQPTIPHLTRSALHRCFQRHGISPLPEITGDKPQKKRFAAYPIGYFHIDIAEVQTEEGKLRLFVAIDRTSKFAFVRLVESAGKMEAAQFLRDLIEAVPYRIHTVLTDNGVQFTPRKQDIWDSTHIFDRVCEQHDI